LHKIHSQVSTNAKCTNLRERSHITSSDRGESGFIARFTLSSYTIWRSKLHYFRQNYTTVETYLWTTWNSNRLLQGRLQVNSIFRALHAFYTDWNATVRGLRYWNFHLLLFWLALSLLCDVSYV